MGEGGGTPPDDKAANEEDEEDKDEEKEGNEFTPAPGELGKGENGTGEASLNELIDEDELLSTRNVSRAEILVNSSFFALIVAGTLLFVVGIILLFC
ncbi:hypothetical protein D3C80_1815800 [compost metagenome]